VAVKRRKTNRTSASRTHLLVRLIEGPSAPPAAEKRTPARSGRTVRLAGTLKATEPAAVGAGSDSTGSLFSNGNSGTEHEL
jgi:hypothetical protein